MEQRSSLEVQEAGRSADWVKCFYSWLMQSGHYQLYTYTVRFGLQRTRGNGEWIDTTLELDTRMMMTSQPIWTGFFDFRAVLNGLY